MFVTVFFHYYIIFNTELQITIFHTMHLYIHDIMMPSSLLGIHHLIVFETNWTVSRNHSRNACRFFFLGSFADRRSRIFMFHIVLPIFVSWKLICFAIEACRVYPKRLMIKRRGRAEFWSCVLLHGFVVVVAR